MIFLSSVHLFILELIALLAAPRMPRQKGAIVMIDGSFCVLVNSSDRARDIFEVVFRNAEQMWRNCDWPRFAGFTTAQPELYGFKSVSAKKPSDWRGELADQLDALPPEIKYVLRLDEDAFACFPVDGRKLNAVAELMLRCNLCHVKLMPVARNPVGRTVEYWRGKISKFPLRPIAFTEPYYCSLVPSIWKRSYLREILRKPGSIWDFELTVTDERHFAVWQPVLDLDYIVTKGRWSRNAARLLARQGLDHSGSKRGVQTLGSWLRQRRERLSFFLFGFRGFRIRRRFKRLPRVPKDLKRDEFGTAAGGGQAGRKVGGV